MAVVELKVEAAADGPSDDLVGTGCFICYGQATDAGPLVDFQHLECCQVCVCRPCLRTYLAVNAQKGARRYVRCPAPACGKPFGLDAVGRYGDAETRAACGAFWNDAAAGEAAPASGDGAWRLPRWGDKDPHEAAFERWAAARRNVKPCPVCGITIEKDGGCNLMICHCGHRFCWDCLSAAASHSAAACKIGRVADHPAWGPPPVRVVAKPVGLVLSASVLTFTVAVSAALVILIPAVVGFSIFYSVSSLRLTVTGEGPPDPADSESSEVSLVRA